MSPASKRIPPGLARVRKEIPPPGKVFRDKKEDSRKRSKDELRQDLKKSLLAQIFLIVLCDLHIERGQSNQACPLFFCVMADSNLADEQKAHSRLVLYQVSLGLVLVAINHRAIQVRPA